MLRLWLLILAALACDPARAIAQNSAHELCPRPRAGSAVPEPADLRSENGVLKVEFAYRNSTGADGETRYCYVSKDGSQAPTLRLKPGDVLILRLTNELTATSPSRTASGPAVAPMAMGSGGDSLSMAVSDPCASAKMTPDSTNLHFHGLTVPAVCHQDDVLKTAIQPGDPPFEYRFQIPADEPPGLYWYHPHIHGYTKAQVLGGASGAMIVEGIERTNRELAGLPERVMIVRDQDLVNPNAAPTQTGSSPMPPISLDAEGDARNAGTGAGKPAKDLSLNFVPVPYPDYSPAVIAMRPSERQLWRVLNASAITYLNLQVMFGNAAQALGVVALDGVPINENGTPGNRAIWVSHAGIPPGGRIEFIVKGPPDGVKGSLVTRSVNTGVGGENDPARPLATIVASANAPEPHSRLASSPQPLPPPTSTWIGNVKPIRTRKLYFSETLEDPNDPNSPTTFMLTVEGQTPKPYDMNATIPNITVQQGDVEDWIIENRTQELHDFHIHQIHFMLLDWFGLPVDEPFLRDTVNVPFWDGKNAAYPMVKLRMDFRDPNSIGTFIYHCHLLEHEDGGMMGTIRVVPRAQDAKK
ncbi:MAG TPA: multicopper oxidase domain-containing protein [Candidatus Acidoferrales bacterium]|nr:multicopper oxidase domain-containing protein [Candidatus Acidoferrales bacterium]